MASQRKPFFQSIRHPHCQMNKWGVVLVPNGHADGADFFGASFVYVPLRNGLLDLQREIEREAWDAGLGMDWRKRPPRWVKRDWQLDEKG